MAPRRISGRHGNVTVIIEIHGDLAKDYRQAEQDRQIEADKAADSFIAAVAFAAQHIILHALSLGSSVKAKIDRVCEQLRSDVQRL